MEENFSSSFLFRLCEGFSPKQSSKANFYYFTSNHFELVSVNDNSDKNEIKLAREDTNQSSGFQITETVYDSIT
ncbi:MAG: hypothetical protein LC122_03280 [Chitinophagales bacterium]|nr:hypothetical protein [Chitinophagales bacterium]